MSRMDLSHPGIQEHPHPTFENRSSNFPNLPDLSLRWAFVGNSGSGKGYAMLDLLLRHYRGKFDRIYLYSKSATIDKNWDPLKRYVEEQGVDQRDEKTFFDEFDAEALQEQMDLQMQVAEYAKKSKMRQIPQVLWHRNASHPFSSFLGKRVGSHTKVPRPCKRHSDQPERALHMAGA